jgi:predicted transcriptional regulator
MDREELLMKYSRLLERYGFSETYAYNMRSSFDIISRKRDRIMILKLVDNIDSLGEGEASSLRKLGGFFDADVFVVFNKYKGKGTGKDLVFTRHGVDCISNSTFESVLNGKRPPKAQRFIGAKFKIDASELKRLRTLQNMSMKSLSTIVKVSKDSIYRYEKGEAFAKGPALKKLEAFFKTNVIEVPENTTAQPISYKYHKINESLDIDFINVGASPFHMLGKRHSRYEIGIEADSRTMKKMADFYKSFSSVLDEDYQFFIAHKTIRERIYGIPVLTKEELSRIKEEKELIDAISSKKKD